MPCMRNSLLLTTLLICILCSGAIAEDLQQSQDEAKTYIVMFTESGNKAIVEKYGTIDYEFKAINGVTATLTPEAAELLAQEEGIALVEADQEIEIGSATQAPLKIRPAGDQIVSANGMAESSTSQWNLGKTGINAEDAWSAYNTYGSGIKIAIIDSGVNYNLPDLTEGYLGGKDFCPTGTGTTCTGEDNDPMDTWGHGTEAASVMLGTGDMIKGVAPEAQYYALKITNSDGRSSGSIVLKALDWIAANGNADIVYFGFHAWLNQSVGKIIEENYNNKETLYLAPSYNSTTESYPAVQDEVIGVGAHSQFEPQVVMGTTGTFADLLAPGENVPVLALDGSVVTAVDSVGVAAAQVAGQLAMMIDFNRQRDLGYSNSDLWKTMLYSAEKKWPSDSQAGWGKADVNSALKWMDKNWKINYYVSYMWPSAMDGTTPVYYANRDPTEPGYYTGNIRYAVILMNTSDQNFYNLELTTYPINLDGENAYEKIEGATEKKITIPKLESTYPEFWRTVWAYGIISITVPFDSEPGLKGIQIELKMGPTTVADTFDLPAGPTLEMAHNSFKLEPTPDGNYLHLINMPSYEKEQPYYSGAATAKMILDYVRSAASYPTLSQEEIYGYAAPDANEDFDAEAMDAVLGHFDPYDRNVSNSLDTFDTLYDGNPYQGYNYGVEAYDNVLDYIKDIVHWMAWPVTREAWWLHGELVKTFNTPAAIPVYGNYNHWVAINGYSVSEDPTPDPYDPWTVKPFTVYGFWLTDPDTNGIGSHVYVTAAEAQSTYFLPMDTNDAYDGKYLQVAEPPERQPQDETEAYGAQQSRMASIPAMAGDEIATTPAEINTITVQAENQAMAEAMVQEAIEAQIPKDFEQPKQPIVTIAKPAAKPANLELIKRLAKE